ncbi:Fic family protein [Haoranjiania flava]|uniref:Fic family protein n=1 Tax=Haoranjiania flava TaxID=1856322 RepID=A0AAE3LPL4_9BACT|nr:Fic family protein [Haoranjiania flava]MCU7693600.1 Fic family protein [Haoranjiania flava]
MIDFDPGNYLSHGSYKSFQPSFINRQWLLSDMEIQKLLSLADRHLGRLDMYSEYIPNIDLFISMHIRKEATQSSKIEGTQTNIEDVLLSKEEIDPERRDDWQEVNNYIEAINAAIDKIKDLPFSSRLIRNTHKILLTGVRGYHKMPGEFRTSQNWIGGATINDAVFVPPVHTSIQELMSDLEHFAHNDEIFLPELLKIALIHYQFETIHPFLDGNGRIGRLIIILYLLQKNILKKPVLYLSDFFERNRLLYYDNLNRVRTHGDLKQWFKFFLVGVIETAKTGIETFDNILKLKQDAENKIRLKSRRAKHLLMLMHHLYQTPLISAAKAMEITGVSQNTSYRLLEELQMLDIINEVTGTKKNKMYMYQDYIALFKK